MTLSYLALMISSQELAVSRMTSPQVCADLTPAAFSSFHNLATAETGGRRGFRDEPMKTLCCSVTWTDGSEELAPAPFDALVYCHSTGPLWSRSGPRAPSSGGTLVWTPAEAFIHDVGHKTTDLMFKNIHLIKTAVKTTTSS